MKMLTVAMSCGKKWRRLLAGDLHLFQVLFRGFCLGSRLYYSFQICQLQLGRIQSAFSAALLRARSARILRGLD